MVKFWELHSIARADIAVVGEVASANPEWSHFADWSREFGDLVARQDRGRLDCELPDAFCRAVLERVERSFYLGADCLRSYRFTEADSQLSMLETYERFGGSAIEETLERGSWSVGGSQ